MLGVVNEQVKKFLIVLQKKGGVINRVAAVATAKVLISRSLGSKSFCANELRQTFCNNIKTETKNYGNNYLRK